MIFGGLGATAIVVYGLGPPGLRLPLMIAASALGGMAWALLPALLAYRLRINEIITTLLLNYVAAAVMLELLFGPWHDPKDFFPHSQVFGAAERFSKLAGVGTEMLLALGVALLMAWLVHGSRIGLYMKVIHANPRMALAVGLPVAAVSFGAVLLSGAIAGLAGLVLVSQEGRLSDGFVAGYGFSGILIAFLARNHPAAVGVVALLVAMLFEAIAWAGLDNLVLPLVGYLLLRIYLALVWPNSGFATGRLVDGYEQLNGAAMLLGRLQNPAVPVRLSVLL